MSDPKPTGRSVPLHGTYWRFGVSRRMPRRGIEGQRCPLELRQDISERRGGLMSAMAIFHQSHLGCVKEFKSIQQIGVLSSAHGPCQS